ncbi:MAG: arylamine N-acetyltransferase [Clostridiales bacterium]|nr:arylamine N-acetyltransferase [Clostridiales bacterium]
MDEKMLCRFFERIGLDKDTKVEKTVAFLGLLQSSCIKNIAYENIDILSGKPLSLDPLSLFEKIVINRRGGYCFELNGFLKHVLLALGFDASDRFARFLRGEEDIPMRRHRVVVVKLYGEEYLCDIGVGQYMPRYPLKIEEGIVQEQNGEEYRFERDNTHGWVLMEKHKGQWRKLICFIEYPAFDIDFVQPSFFCEKHPDSVFNKSPMIAIKTDGGRKAINGSEYKVFFGDELIHIEENITNERYTELLKNEFKLGI